MSLKTLAHAASRGVSKQVFTVKRHSPVLLFGAGAVGFVATCALSIRATLKLSDVLEESEGILKAAEKQKNDPDYDTEVATKATFSIKLQTSIKIAKLYAPAVLVGSASIAALTGSHFILQRRNTGLIAAYATVDSMYKRYRERVIADQGDEKDHEYRFGVVEKSVVDPETGEVAVARGVDSDEVKKWEFSDYARMFDKSNENWEPSPRQNMFYLQSVIKHFEDVLRLQGYVFLNDVYKYLGISPTKAGAIVGWVRDAHLQKKGDGYISFGLERNTENATKFIDGRLSDVIIDPNVDGVITYIFDEV